MAAQWFVNIFAAYVAIGLFFAIVFATVGVSRIDPVAKGSGIGFRMIILPGATALWPLLLWRWVKKGTR